ncbi:valine--tRNA ligase [Candidatus Woesearchaeota archaeon]|nr:valine--tRNA ligase [Candidatus Woesearchaeota archaeon]
MKENYNPNEAEPRLQKFWETNKIYQFDIKSKKPIFSIDTPPPTVSGKMHMGHAFSYSQMDFIARYKRMKGYNLFYPFGTDDNGLPTERLIEREKGVKAVDMERKAFVKLCLDSLEKEFRPRYIQDWKKIGMSCDFSLFYTTINEHSQKISQKSFLDLYRQKRAYRKEGPTIWCTECRTAIAQVEMQDEEKMTDLVYIEVKTEDGTPLVFATTRPELYPSCVGMSVNPEDARYKNIVGKKVVMPITGSKIIVTADKIVDPNFATGVVYFCSSGDAQFLEWEKNHPVKNKIYILNKDGTMNQDAGKYKGLNILETRKKIVEDLQAIGAVKKIEPLKHVVNVHERCGTDVEYRVSKQWFIKYLDLKEKFLKDGGKLNWHPEYMKVRYDNWVKGLQWDWCISRQRYFGVPFPVWYCKKCSETILADEKDLPADPLYKRPNVAKCPKCSCKEFIPEKDVLDTWATSSLTPRIAIELIKNESLKKKLFPMSLRAQAQDIITFWLVNTLVKSQLHFKKNPWKDVMISGWGLDPKGKKMSKSKGNIIEPQDMMKKYSSDCLRFWASGSKLGDNLAFQEKELIACQKITVKLWNASKFVFMHMEDFNFKKPKKILTTDRCLVSKLNKLVKDCTESFDSYDYSRVKLDTEQFFWHTFCDNYLEIIKDRLYNPDKRGKEARLSAQYALYASLLKIIKLMAPIIPHITEEVYQKYFLKNEKIKSIHISEWPEIEAVDKKLNESYEELMNLISEVRMYKNQNKKSLKESVDITLPRKYEKFDKDLLEDFKAVTNTRSLSFGKDMKISF